MRDTILSICIILISSASICSSVSLMLLNNRIIETQTQVDSLQVNVSEQSPKQQPLPLKQQPQSVLPLTSDSDAICYPFKLKMF